MTDDTCGAPTQGGDGPPCQNPTSRSRDPTRCWIPSHNDPEAENPQGSPSTFCDEDARIAVEAARKGKSESGVEREVGVGEGTIFGKGGWLDQEHTYTDVKGNERDFFRSLRRARSTGEDGWIEEGRGEDGDSSFAKFMLSTSYEYVKTEKQELEDVTDGSDGFGTTVVLDSEYVDDE